MYKHHKESLDNLISEYRKNKDILAIIIAGSIAKGRERVDSDIDLIIIVTDKMYSKLKNKNKISECFSKHITYDKGYFDIKYHTKDFLIRASKNGSEPTRNSFIGTKCIYSIDDSIDNVLKEIPIYQVCEKENKMLSFYASLIIYSKFFYKESIKLDDIYLKTRTVTDIVLYGLRLLYAYNETLFPCHKWLLRVANDLEYKPKDIVIKAKLFLSKMDNDSMNDFVTSILDFCKLDIPKDFSVVTKFIEDNEQWWYENRPNIAEY